MAKIHTEGLTIDYSEDGWAEYVKWLDGTYMSLLYAWVDEGLAYNIVATDGPFYRTFSINKADAADFEANYKDRANAPNLHGEFYDPRLIRRFGNLTAAATSEVLLCSRGYIEQSSEAQRSVVSTSNSDKPGSSGAAQVRIEYLNSAYELKTEDIVLDGTKDVDTVSTDIRFIERFHVIQGAAAAGAIKLMTETAGDGVEFCGIGAYTYDAFLCHHYVPAGKWGWVYGWGASVDDEAKFKLMGRSTYGANVVNEHWDLINLMGITIPPGLLTFEKRLMAVPIQETAYVKVTVVPNQATSTTIRGELLVWEQ